MTSLKIIVDAMTHMRCFTHRITAQGDFFVAKHDAYDLYYGLLPNASGVRDEALYVYSVCTLTQGVLLKALSQTDIIVDFAENRERAWTVCSSRAATRRFAEQVVAAGPAIAAAYCSNKAPELLSRSGQLLVAAKQYYELYKRGGYAHGAHCHESGVTRSEAEYFAEMAASAWVDADSSLFTSVSLCVLNNIRLVEPQLSSRVHADAESRLCISERVLVVCDMVMFAQ